MRQGRTHLALAGAIRIATILWLAGMPVVGAKAEGTPSQPGSTSKADPAGAKAGETAPAKPSGGSGKDCAGAYHQSLRQIATTEYPRIKAARTLALEGDERLPGMLLFPLSAAKRTRSELSAFATATSLARSKGRSGWKRDADSRWIGDRIGIDLGDYLDQKPSPYLCGGVGNYVETLRRFAGRLDASTEKRGEWVEAVRAAARRDIEEALAAARPAPLPRFAPADRPTPMPDDLRPASGLQRSDIEAPPAGVSPPGIDEDLPPLRAPQPVPLQSVANLVAAVDRLTNAVEAAGFVAAQPNDTAFRSEPALSVATHPVLASLSRARPFVLGPRPRIRDRLMLMRLTTAFSDIEALDYLMRAEASAGDPLAGAITGTLDAIAAANRRDCTCGPK